MVGGSFYSYLKLTRRIPHLCYQFIKSKSNNLIIHILRLSLKSVEKTNVFVSYITNFNNRCFKASRVKLVLKELVKRVI